MNTVNHFNLLNYYSIEPVDVLLMRESKPFSPAEGSWAKCLFPPMPITVFQALRSQTLRIVGNRVQHRLRFLGPFLLRTLPGQEPEVWLPTPNDLIGVRLVHRGSSPDQQEASVWDYLVRLQPLDEQHFGWRYLSVDPDLFSDGGPAPMVSPNLSVELAEKEISPDKEPRLIGPPKPWIRARALLKYLKGESLSAHEDFHDHPWTEQVLPHIKVKTGTRQVADEAGYFTEVAMRLHPYWKLVAGISADLPSTTVRLGGEGHHALLQPLSEVPDLRVLLEHHSSPQVHSNTAYLLTPGLAEVSPSVYGLIPERWCRYLSGCAGGRPLLWGGMSVFQKETDQAGTPAFLPQRAFVPPGTIYRFRQIPKPPEQLLPEQLLPTTGGNWLQTFRSLNYGTLLWSNPND